MLGDNQTLVERVKYTSARWNPLRKVDTLGQFDFNTGVVMLDSIESPAVRGISLSDLVSEEKLDLATFTRLSKALALAVHEYTHFVDSTSTVWGLRHLRMLDRAYNCDRTDESKFHVMRQCYSHLKRLKLPDYYTAVPNEYEATRPWQWRLSAGREFRHDGKPGERPILFGRFYNATGQFLARSPISVISLLETCAMAEEIEATSRLVQRIEDEGERLVQERIYEKEMLDYLYDVKRTEYSVCAHMVANRFNVKDARVAFRVSSLIARIALNSSRMVYETINKNLKAFLARVKIGANDPEAKLLRRALTDYNPGAIFYIVWLQIDKDALDSLPRFGVSLVAGMYSLGVRFEFFMKTALDEADGLTAELRKSPCNTIAKFGSAGFENLTRMIHDFGIIDLQKMNLPPALLGDSAQYKFHDVELNSLCDFDVDDAYLEMVDGQLRMEDFGDACL